VYDAKHKRANSDQQSHSTERVKYRAARALQGAWGISDGLVNRHVVQILGPTFDLGPGDNL
jgi:hypothetical protein